MDGEIMETLYGNCTTQTIQDLLFEKVKERTLRRHAITIVDCFDTFKYSKRAKVLP